MTTGSFVTRRIPAKASDAPWSLPESVKQRLAPRRGQAGLSRSSRQLATVPSARDRIEHQRAGADQDRRANPFRDTCAHMPPRERSG